MAPKLDFRKTLRGIATSIQAANQDRLLSGQSLASGPLAPRVESTSSSATKKRVRIAGIRVKLAELTGNVGVASGALLKDLTRAGNIKLGRTSFKIVPSPDVLLRMLCFVHGSLNTRISSSERRAGLHKAPEASIRGGLHQVPRPFSGIPGAILDQAAAQLAADGNEQMCAGMQSDLEDARASSPEAGYGES